MTTIICHDKGKYNIFSTVSDNFYFRSALNLDQLTQWYRDEYGKQGMLGLGVRLERTHTKGTSSLMDSSLEECLFLNRTGKNGSSLSYTKCLEIFLS